MRSRLPQFVHAWMLVRFGQGVKVVHFIGAVKPWNAAFNRATHSLEGAGGGQPTDFLQQWWRVFLDQVYPRLNDILVGLRMLAGTTNNFLGLGAILSFCFNAIHCFLPMHLITFIKKNRKRMVPRRNNASLELARSSEKESSRSSVNWVNCKKRKKSLFWVQLIESINSMLLVFLALKVRGSLFIFYKFDLWFYELVPFSFNIFRGSDWNFDWAKKHIWIKEIWSLKI